MEVVVVEMTSESDVGSGDDGSSEDEAVVNDAAGSVLKIEAVTEDVVQGGRLPSEHTTPGTNVDEVVVCSNPVFSAIPVLRFLSNILLLRRGHMIKTRRLQ